MISTADNRMSLDFFKDEIGEDVKNLAVSGDKLTTNMSMMVGDKDDCLSMKFDQNGIMDTDQQN